jgi:hypothetical protein
MRPGVSRVLALAVFVTLLGATSTPLSLRIAAAGDPPPPPGKPPAPASDAGDEPDDPPPPKSALSTADAAKCKAEFDAALALAEKHDYAHSRKKFAQFLEHWPLADADLRREADERSAENCLLGLEEIHHGGPSDNRIDVELMGDGYTYDQVLQEKFAKHAEAQIKQFWAEPLYAEYESYFNVWRFDLVSKEEGVDDPGAPPQDAPPPPDPTKKPPKGKKNKRAIHQYSTALNCQAAGPQRQVWADPEMVYKWRKYLKESDGLSLCFAKKGELGMGGGGIATTGRLIAVVHEFGHAFVGLLDEYANNPNMPPGRISAPNAISGHGPKDPPKPEEVPWKHWIDLGNKEVGVFLGGATFQQGVWRPASSGCAMNAGGGGTYCWVCREKGVLEIYEYVNPIDDAWPKDSHVAVPTGGKLELGVVPMQPKTHKLLVDWWIEKLKSRVTTKDDDAEGEGDDPGAGGDASASDGRPGGGEPMRLTPDGFSRGPMRGAARHASPWPPGAPRGEELAATEKKAKDGSVRSTVLLENLAFGTYRVTVRVRDDAKIPQYKYPWVIKDRDKLLEERREWIVAVGGTSGPPQPTAPVPGKGVGGMDAGR